MPLNNYNLPQQVVQQASSSPVKVHGTIINVSGDFGRVARQGGIVLDKSLLCKALFDTHAPIRVCLPRRFGKTFNLSVIEEFFNVITCKDAKLVDGNVDKAAGRANRMELFKDSLLRGEHPEFFEEHFCKTPVIRINMKDTRVSSVGGFYKALTKSVCRIAEIWHSDAKKVEWDTSAKRAWSNLEAAIDEVDSDNPNTLTGVLVGVHEIELDDLGSGPNNIVTLALTVPKHTETLNANAMGIVSYNKFGELFAFTQAEVEALVEKVQEKNPHLEMYSVELIMSKIIEWYDGYCFGVSVGKFNPFSVTTYLMNLCASSPGGAASCYWDRTGNQDLVNRIALLNRASMLILGTEFLVGCGKDPRFGAVKQAGVWQWLSPRPLGSRPVLEVHVGRGYAIDVSSVMSIDQLVSLFVYTGYLTIRQGGHIGIPNGEMRQMWERALKITCNGTENVF
ncbi:hypothetical protein GGH14_002053 [Coemansia sp. RSA 370]|nr:hypothetical protein GGH14_002053 [Coemansia sp. RSA 370]KAJ2292790.1 hypothetical protein IW141_001614 [Coemansia sp. RSA 355]